MAEPARTADEDFPVPMEHPAGSSIMAGPAPAAGAEVGAATSSLSQTAARGQPKTQQQQQKQKNPRLCKFYATNAGCKNGDACPYSHTIPQSSRRGADRLGAPGAKQSPVANQPGSGSLRHSARGDSETGASATRRHQPTVDPSRVVRRPVPAGENVPEVRRKNEISQLKRRWGPLFQDVDQAQGLYRLELKQSEDFPYDLDALKIELTVPPEYPAADVTIRVLNEDIPRGHQINIERGFSNLVMAASKTTRLLDLFNNLDKRLEDLLSSEKATTFKIVPNVGIFTQDLGQLSINDHQTQKQEASAQLPPPPPPPPQPVERKEPVKPTYTEAEKAAAAPRRALEVRQLEARNRQSDKFWRNSDGTLFKVPIEPRMRGELPAALLLLKTVDLRVPQLFPLEPCRISFGHEFPRSITDGIEKNFLKRATEKPEVSLMAQLNYLSQNLHMMVESEPEPEAEIVEQHPTKIVESKEDPALAREAATLVTVPDKPHIIRIENVRPPEWDQSGSSESDSEDTAEDDDDVVGVTEKSDVVVEHESEPPEALSTVERGTSISFPDIKLKNIELLELKNLNLTVKCSRCKTVADINNIKARENKHSRPKLLGCEKCASVIGIDYRRELIHEHHTRAGFLDLSGCTVVDLLPSDFVPTCATCSNALAGGIQAVTRSQTMFLNCRSCFAKMSIFVPEIRFLRISEDEVDLGAGGQIRRQRENLGLVVGTELPLKGRCEHYRKSTRWFRFSCCNRVYPCDRCHDNSVEPKHPNEHANRMICGACSREQNYRPDDCAFCGHSFVSKNSGFWEGGKGTRDKTKMSRKDPRKYKRVKA